MNQVYIVDHDNAECAWVACSTLELAKEHAQKVSRITLEWEDKPTHSVAWDGAYRYFVWLIPYEEPTNA